MVYFARSRCPSRPSPRVVYNDTAIGTRDRTSRRPDTTYALMGLTIRERQLFVDAPATTPDTESRPRRSSSRHRPNRRVHSDVFSTSMGMAVFFVLFALHIVSNTDQAVLTADVVNVVRVVRVDVPSVVRAHDAKPDPAGGETPPLLLGCAYALEGGENDDENGEVLAVGPTNATVHGKRSPELVMDAAMEELQRQRGLVVKWYFRRNPVPMVPNDAMAIINDNEQVYQWIAGGGPEAGGGLGPLSGRTVDVTAETPRADRSVLHRVIRVERPTAELTGEYRCQVEDWNAERRSVWHPMVVYTPERMFKVTVDDNDDDDEDDISEGSGGDGNTTTPAPSTSSSRAPRTAPKNWPTEINVTCYAAGVHPEPSMSVWVNGVVQDSVTMVVTEDDGDDDENNDGAATGAGGEKNGGTASTTTTTTATTTTTTTTTAKPKVTYRNRYRMNRGDDAQYNKKYTVRANKVVSLKDAERHGAAQNKHRRRNAVEVECRLRVPGDGAGNGYWKADRPAGLYYGARRSVVYKYSAGSPLSPDAFAAVSSASSVADSNADDVDGDADDDGAEDTATAPGTDNGAGGRPQVRALLVLSAIAAVRR